MARSDRRQDVAGHGPHHRFTTEHPPQLGHLRLQRVRRVARLIVTPQLVDQPIVRTGVRHSERKQRQQRLKLDPRHRTRTRAVVDLDRAEQRHRDGHHDSTRRSPPTLATASRPAADPVPGFSSGPPQHRSARCSHADDRSHPAQRSARRSNPGPPRRRPARRPAALGGSARQRTFQIAGLGIRAHRRLGHRRLVAVGPAPLPRRAPNAPRRARRHAAAPDSSPK